VAENSEDVLDASPPVSDCDIDSVVMTGNSEDELRVVLREEDSRFAPVPGVEAELPSEMSVED
jgi:hypothetical protein